MKRTLLGLAFCSSCLVLGCASGERNQSESTNSSDEDASEGKDQDDDTSQKSGKSKPSTSGSDDTPSGTSNEPSGDGSDQGSTSDTQEETNSKSSSEDPGTSGSDDKSGDSGNPDDFILKLTVDESPKAGGAIPSDDVRFAVDIQSPDPKDLKAKGIKKNLIDRAVSIKDSQFKISIPRPSLTEDLGDKTSIILPTLLYIDKDQDKSFGPDDKVLGTLRNYLVFHGPDSKEPEWAVIDADSQKVAKITAPLPLLRLDQRKAVSSLDIGGKVAALANDFHSVVLVTAKEFRDLKNEHIKGERNLDQQILRDSDTWEAAISGALEAPRQGAFVPGFGEHGIAWMAGYYNSKGNEHFLLGAQSKIIRNICHEKSAVVAIWFSPEQWIQSSEGARRAAVFGIQPGWNLGAAKRDVDSIRIKSLDVDDGKELSANDDCRVEAGSASFRTP